MAIAIGGGGGTGGVVSYGTPIFKLVNTNTLTPASNIITLRDDTGNFITATNPGGYGYPNTPRNLVALFIVAQYKTTKGDVSQAVSPYDPLSASTFNITISNDGWYKFSMLHIPIYDPLEILNYSPGQVLYDTSAASLVMIVDTLVPGSNPPEFNRSTADATVADADETVLTVAFVEYFHIANNSKTKLRINTAISDLLLNDVTFTDKRLIRLKDNYNALRAILQGSIYEYSRGNKYVAQKNIEFLNTNNYEVY